jgi:hypothetical protein
MKRACRLFFLLLAAPHFVLALHGQEFKPRKVVPPFDAITEPKVAPAAGAERWVQEHELVLGVVVGDEARAYPINQLTNPTREIINDTLGDRSIAATW